MAPSSRSQLTSPGLRLASLRIAPGLHDACAHCTATITEADLACSVTLEGFEHARTLNFHHSCYREWALQSSSNELDATDTELAEGLQR